MWALILALACGRGSRGGAPVLDETQTSLAVGPVETLLAEGGLVLERQRWTFGATGGAAWRVSVPLGGRAAVVPSTAVVDFEDLLPAEDAGPWAAINGGFYDTDKHPMGLVVSGGKVFHPLRRGGGSGIFQLGPDGPAVLHRDLWAEGPGEALQSIDRLVDQGASVVEHRPASRAARSALVVGRDRLWEVALASDESVTEVADGVVLAHTSGAGLPLWAFADYLVSTTAPVSALNLDGAVSTSLAVVAAGRRFRVYGERGTINAVVLRP